MNDDDIPPLVPSGDLAPAPRRVLTGRERLARLNETLDTLGPARSRMQRDFHRNMTLDVIHKIFKDDIDENAEQLRVELHVGAQGNPLYFRDRKYYTAMFMAALAYALEQSDVRIYTPSHRVFQKMSELVAQFLCKLPVAGKLIHVIRVEDKPP